MQLLVLDLNSIIYWTLSLLNYNLLMVLLKIDCQVVFCPLSSLLSQAPFAGLQCVQSLRLSCPAHVEVQYR